VSSKASEVKYPVCQHDPIFSLFTGVQAVVDLMTDGTNKNELSNQGLFNSTQQGTLDCSLHYISSSQIALIISRMDRVHTAVRQILE
jgi:hypothetical protein